MLAALATIWVLHLAATATPGANTLLIAQLAVSGNSRAANYAAIGVAVGSAAWALFALLGLNVVFSTFPYIRLALQALGGLYLVWLAVRFWCFKGDSRPPAIESRSMHKAFRLGLLTNFTNPKAALFFGSIFAACLPANAPLWLSIAAVVVIFLNSFGWYSLLAHLLYKASVRSAYIENLQFARRVSACTIGGIGISMLFKSVKEAKSYA